MTDPIRRKRRIRGGIGLVGVVGVFLAIGVALALVIIPITANVSSNEFAAPTTSSTTTTTAPPTNGLQMSVAPPGPNDCGGPGFFSTGPLLLTDFQFDLNSTGQQLVGLLCAANTTGSPVNTMNLAFAVVSTGEDGCSAAEGVVDPEGNSCGTAGELADILEFTFVKFFDTSGTCIGSGTVSTSSPSINLGNLQPGSNEQCIWQIFAAFNGPTTDDQKQAASTDLAAFSLDVTATP